MEHKLHLYTGNGKGKTTAAMGLALRALGHGQRVLIVQFMKDGTSGELVSLTKLKGVEVFIPHPFTGFTFTMTEEERQQACCEQTLLAAETEKRICEIRPQTIILDELGMALSTGLVRETAAKALLDTALVYGETVVTGYSAPEWLHERSDYVSVITSEKHPYATQGLEAREGVEW